MYKRHQGSRVVLHLLMSEKTKFKLFCLLLFFGIIGGWIYLAQYVYFDTPNEDDYDGSQVGWRGMAWVLGVGGAFLFACIYYRATAFGGAAHILWEWLGPYIKKSLLFTWNKLNSDNPLATEKENQEQRERAEILYLSEQEKAKEMLKIKRIRKLYEEQNKDKWKRFWKQKKTMDTQKQKTKIKSTLKVLGGIIVVGIVFLAWTNPSAKQLEESVPVLVKIDWNEDTEVRVGRTANYILYSKFRVEVYKKGEKRRGSRPAQNDERVQHGDFIGVAGNFYLK